MTRWTAVVCVATLAGCAGPQISITDVSPRRIEFLVQNAWLVPMQEVDKQAANHCWHHRLSYRQTESVWIGPSFKQVAYQCVSAASHKPEAPRTSVHPSPSAVAKPASKDLKAAAWANAKTAADEWALCLRFVGERKAQETVEAPQSVAQAVVDACSGLEHAVHAPLAAVGEDSSGLQTDLHAEAVQYAADTVAGVWRKIGVSISGLQHFGTVGEAE